MAEPINLPEEELQLLVSLQSKWNELTKRFGELHFQRKGLEAELQITDEELDLLDQERVDVVKRLQDKYGQGVVNLATGEFIPDDPLTTQ
jgi:DNA transposition AAA+ family ATPase